VDERIEVDGQAFDVSRRPGLQPVYDFTWVAGRHAGDYGFTSAVYGGAELGREQLERTVQDFLSQIDPETGFID